MGFTLSSSAVLAQKGREIRRGHIATMVTLSLRRGEDYICKGWITSYGDKRFTE